METLEQQPEDIKQPIALLVYKIAQGIQRMDKNVKKVTAINKELIQVAEVQKQHIKVITP